MGVTALIVALLAQAPAQLEPPTIMAVEVRLPSGADPKLLQSVTRLVTVRRGQALSRRAVQRSLENLWSELHLSDAVVTSADVEGGVALTFDLTPRVPIKEVYSEGARAIPPPDVVAGSLLEPNGDYWMERVDQAAETVRELYRRKGFLRAIVETRVVPVEGGVSVGFLITEGEPTPITALSIVGDPGLPTKTLVDVVGVRLGDVLDMTRLDSGADALRAYFRREHHYRARVEAPRADSLGRVTFPIIAGPRYTIAFRGNRQVSDHALSVVLGYDGEELLDETLQSRLAARVSRFYRFRGYYDVQVTPVEVARGPRATVTFVVDEGAPLRVVSLSFDGNEAVPDSELRDVLAQVVQTAAHPTPTEVHGTGDPLELQGRGPAPIAESLPSPAPETVFDEATWGEAAHAMTALYRERGYLQAKVRFDHLDVLGQDASGHFIVEEGVQTRFAHLSARGLPPGVADTVDPQLIASPFSRERLERARQATLRELGRHGYLFASVEATYTVDPTGRTADCLLAVTPGPQVHVRAVLPVGNERTNDSVLLNEATMFEGAPLDADALFRTQNALMGLGIFRSAEVQVLSPEVAEPLKTVVLKVRERPRLSGEIGLGYFLADGPRIVFDLSAPNLGGRAVNLTAHGQFNFFALSAPALSGQVDVSDLAAWEQLGGRGNISIGSRSLLPNVGVRLDVLGERVFRPQFRFTRFAGVPTVDWSTTFEIPRLDWVRPRLSLALQYELEWSRVTRAGNTLDTQLPSNLVDQERLRFRYGTFALQTVRFSPTLDLRDSSLNPTRGLLLQGSAEVVGALFAQDLDNKQVIVNFLKASALVSGYVPIVRTVLAVSVRAGRIWPLSQGSSTPPVKRFFLGGATSMRGFNEDQLIAEDLRTQYRREVGNCRVLAVKDGCTSAARAVLADRQVPSQGGELYAMLKAELRLPAISVFDLGLFFETGNLWLDAPTTFALRSIAGIGLRYATPIGPLALDLGINLAPDIVINEPAFVVHFNIGVF